jgi:DNA-binding response OmpR family regulator
MVSAIRPDIVLLDARWPRRALLRAQLIEEGYEVVATDEWSTARTYLEALMKPRLAIVDLQDLPNAVPILDEVAAHMRPERVLVLSAIGTMQPDELRKRGFRTLARPAAVSDVVKRAAELVRLGK